ncbi:MAG: hypothetical protein M2R45_04764 [Verrucomicrobia subdivision 3 bacterium]|nr:hypothetical protein [Limisphaerales bacterium]MCS1415093.1 hypothetical protein [Limisphaerales bacterium]
MSKRKRKWHECNVVQADEAAVHLWQFNASDRNFALKSERTETGGSPLPPKTVGKTWQNLIQGKLNIAWLPENQVFLRTIQLPECEREEELRQMLEFQLEKLSPAPISQIVWSYEIIPSSAEGQVTVLLIIVEATIVESELERFESAGCQPDRLEVPWCHELVLVDRATDQLWVRLGQQGDDIVALTAWIIDQTVQHVTLAKLPNTDEGAQSLTEQLDRTAWTGELEGWLSDIPAVQLCSDSEADVLWQERLESWSAHPLETQRARLPQELATISAQRATRSDSRANLLPEGHRTRYRQQYIDGMWMKGIGTIMLMYIFGVLIYFAMLEWIQREYSDLQMQGRTTAQQYTNVLKMQARIDVLQEQVDLKFSALECLRVISEQLPTELRLDSFKFYMGKTLSLYGKVSTADTEKVIDYHRALINAELGDAKLFSNVSDPSITAARGQSRTLSTDSRWSFTCELERSGF